MGYMYPMEFSMGYMYLMEIHVSHGDLHGIHVSHGDLHVYIAILEVKLGPFFGHPVDHLGVVFGSSFMGPMGFLVSIRPHCFSQFLVDQGIVQGPSRESPGASGRPS